MTSAASTGSRRGRRSSSRSPTRVLPVMTHADDPRLGRVGANPPSDDDTPRQGPPRRSQEDHGPLRRPLQGRDRAHAHRPMVRRHRKDRRPRAGGRPRTAPPRSCPSSTRRSTSTGWKTSNPGASRGNCGGGTRSRFGMGHQSMKLDIPNLRTRQSGFERLLSARRMKKKPKQRRLAYYDKLGERQQADLLL